jgi:hypothetical protein
MQVNPREEHDIGGDDGLSCGSRCSTRISTLVEDMDSGVNTLHDFVALFLWDAWRLGKDHGEPSLMSLELGVMPCLEEDLITVLLMFHEDIGAYVHTRDEYLRFKDSNPRIDM